MPKGPQHLKYPADVVSAAVMVGRIPTGEAREKLDPFKEISRKGGLQGGKARADAMTPGRRAQIAKKAAKARWKKGALAD